MKSKRSERLVGMTDYLLNHPHQLISFSYFTEKYQSAKSSISEDIGIMKETFRKQGIGKIETHAGAMGGVCYVPMMEMEQARSFAEGLCQRLSEKERLLPGGYVFLSDLLGDPDVLKNIGRMVAAKYADRKIDTVMTIATKGIPIAQAVAYDLNVPFVIVRRDSKITEGATVSVNYVSGSSERIQKMELSKRSLQKGANILVVDDFMKGGGTVNGMKSLIEEFDAHLEGIVVFAEAAYRGERPIQAYDSLFCVKEVDVPTKTIKVALGNYFDEKE